jgi:hypothetical protein
VCSVLNPSSVLSSTALFFFAALLNEEMNGQDAIVLNIMRDGAIVAEHEEPADGNKYDCYANTAPLGTLQPGAYRFQVFKGTTLEAEGSVTIQ